MIKTIFQELSMIKNQKKISYFMWKNKLKNSKTDYSKFNKEEFIDRYLHGSDISFKRMEQWERTEQYHQLMNVLLHEKSQTDIYVIYEIVREKAMKGDDKAIKTLLLLQKEFNKKNKINLQDGHEEDDGLVIC